MRGRSSTRAMIGIALTLGAAAPHQPGGYHCWQTGFSTWSEWGWLNGSGPSAG